MDESETIPLDDTYRETVTHHHREFQRYSLDNGTYFAPVDDDEVERLHAMHRVFSMMFDNRLIFPPIPSLRRVLDCGYGSASWAMDVAEQHPTCEVIGIDTYPYAVPDGVPANLYLQVDDLNITPSTFPSNHFDLVHSRMMAGAVHANQWSNYLRDILRILRPGGWCQAVEIYFNAQSDNGTLTENHALQIWSQNYMQSLQPFKDPRAALQMQNRMTQEGFVEVETQMLSLPLSGWSNDPTQAALGAANRENVQSLLSSLAIYPFTQHLGMSSQEVQVLVAQARREADNPAFKAYFPVYVCIGRKPVAGGGSRHHGGGGHKGHHHHSARGGRPSDGRRHVRR